MSQANSSRSAPRTRAAISTTPSSVTLPLRSSDTPGALRRALIVHSQSPPPQMWAQISMASG